MQYDISPVVYSYVENIERVSWVTSKENEGIKRYLSRRQGDKRLRPLDNPEHLYDGDMFYFTCIGEMEQLQPVYDIFSKDGRYKCTLQQELYRPKYWCEIMPKGATKANAINDIPMFRISEECYAVENAVDEVKELATGIIGSNNEDGVAKWLEKSYYYGK